MKLSTASLLKLAALAVCGIVFTSCNTVRGVGTDVKKTGRAIERTTH